MVKTNEKSDSECSIFLDFVDSRDDLKPRTLPDLGPLSCLLKGPTGSRQAAGRQAAGRQQAGSRHTHGGLLLCHYSLSLLPPVFLVSGRPHTTKLHFRAQRRML